MYGAPLGYRLWRSDKLRVADCGALASSLSFENALVFDEVLL